MHLLQTVLNATLMTLSCVSIYAIGPLIDFDIEGSQCSFKHNAGNGLGYHQGYSTIGLFFPAQIDGDEHIYAFLDARYHIFNNAKSAANVGIGGRFLSDSLNMVVSTNLYYDYRQTDHYNYHEIGIGAEVLGPCVDFRINGYFPLQTRSHIFDHNRREYALGGADTELGLYLYQGNYFDFYLAGGAYYYRNKHDKDVSGGSVRFLTNVTEYITVQLQGHADNIFHCTGEASISINIPLWGWGEKTPHLIIAPWEPAACDMVCCDRWLDWRLIQLVHRNEIVVTKAQCRNH